MDIHEIVSHGNRLFTIEGLGVLIVTETGDWGKRGGALSGVYSHAGDSLAAILFGQQVSTMQDIDLFDPAGFIRGLALDATGNLYIAGKFLDTLHVGNGAFLVPREPEFPLDQHVALVSYAPSGDLRWAQRLAGTRAGGQRSERISFREEIKPCFILDNTGNSFLCGFFREGTVFGEGQPHSVRFTEGARAVASFDADGRLRWVRTTAEFGVPGDVSPGTLAPDDRGGFGAVWHSYGYEATREQTLFVFGDTTLVRQHGDLNVVAKHAVDGSIEWARQIETEGGYLDIMDMVIDHRGHVYVAGYHEGRWLMVEGQRFIDEEKSDRSSGRTGFVIHYNAAGQLVRVLYVRGVGDNSRVYAVASGESGELYVAGLMENRHRIDRPFIVGQDTLSSESVWFPFLARYEYTSTGIEFVPGFRGNEIRAINYPNPFADATAITYSLPTTTRVRLTVYDLMGRRMTVLIDKEQGAGSHSSWLDASSWPDGIYVYRLEAGEQFTTGSLVHRK